MKTNNHPAHGPVSLDRLHQIREILSKAAAQSDGGNLGYAMADAVKVIDGAIAAFGAEPVAWTEKCEITNMQATGLYLRGFPDNSQGRDIALYTAPPAPVVPDELTREEYRRRFMMEDNFDDTYRGGWNACRAAMLHGTDGKPELTVWYGSMPETNGKTNWTAMLHRKGQHPWEGITIDRSEYPDRVRYEADRMRHLIGELTDEPDILSYDADAHSGYVNPGNSLVTPDGWIMVPKVPTEAMCETGHIGVDVYTGLATEGDGYYSIGGEDAARVWEFMIAMAPKQENTMDHITRLSPKLVSVGMFEQLSFHDGFSLKCRELGIHASKLGHIELSKKAQDLMFSASLQQHDQLVDNMASLIELMADNYMRNTINHPITQDTWTPVSDKLPEIRKGFFDVTVLIAHDGEKECSEAMYCSDGNFRWGRNEDPIENVTHWMEMPAAPQQEVKP